MKIIISILFLIMIFNKVSHKDDESHQADALLYMPNESHFFNASSTPANRSRAFSSVILFIVTISFKNIFYFY